MKGTGEQGRVSTHSILTHDGENCSGACDDFVQERIDRLRKDGREERKEEVAIMDPFVPMIGQ